MHMAPSGGTEWNETGQLPFRMACCFCVCFVCNSKKNYVCFICNSKNSFHERNGSGVELRTLDYENSGSNPVLQC